MRVYSSTLGKALGIARGQRVILSDKSGVLTVSGVSERAAIAIRNELGYDAKGRLRIHPDSQIRKTGAQFVTRL